MPTVQQLPPAVSVNPTDEMMLDQNGVSVAATVSQVLAATVTGVTLTGDVTGSGSSTIVTTLAPVGTPGTFSKVTVNAKGQVTGGGVLASADVSGALGYIPYSAANPSGYVAASALAPIATTGNYADLVGIPAQGGLGAQSPSAVAITGGAISGADVSNASVVAAGSNVPRSPSSRAGDMINVLDYGADATGVSDSAPAFATAMNAVVAGSWGGLRVPRGTYRLNSFLNQPSGHSVAVLFDEGATTVGSGGLGVDRVESKQGAYSLWQGGGGWFGFNPVVGAPQNYAFHTDIVQNGPNNSGSSRIAWSRNYVNANYYAKYAAGIDFAEQNIYSWPHLYDNSSGWGHWEVILGTTYDEDSAARAHVSASGEHSEFDVVNNGPEAGWTYKAGKGLGFQGMSMDPWGQNGLYGGNILFSYGSVGSFDGQSGGLNQRWPSYPAVFSQGNPSTVGTASTIVITFDLAAHGIVSLAGAGVGGVSISSGGGAYTTPPAVVFSGGGGSGAAGTPIMLAGSVVGVSITASGSGYSSAPTVSFTGGGVTTPAPVSVTLNADGSHGDLPSIASAINTAMTGAGFPLVRASVARWGGAVSRLVVFATAPADLGTLTLGGTALAVLGINPGTYKTQRDVNAVVFGGTGGVAVGDKLSINGTVVTVGGSGSMSDVITAIANANIVGIKADKTADGRLVMTCFLPQNPGGMVLAQVPGYTTIGKLGLNAGTFYAPTPPKGFATAYGEVSSPIVRTTDQIAISATDLAGTSYGPVTITLNGGGGSGWVADVATSISTALTTAGWYSAGGFNFNVLTPPPAIVAVSPRGSGGDQSLVLRNTAGGTLTLTNVTGTPLQTLGIAPGTFQPGGYSAGSQSVFMAAEDSIAAQGRGIFLGGASAATDRTVWPNTPLEARGSFLHGLRTDRATFDDNAALLMAPTQAISFGSGAGSVSLTASGGALRVNGTAVALSSAIPAAANMLLGGQPAEGTAGVVALGANLTMASGTLSATGVSSFNGRNGVVLLGSADVVGALGYVPGAGGGAVSSVTAGVGLAGGTITAAGTISLAPVAAASLLGNSGTLTAAPGAVAVGAGMALTSGTLSNAGVVSFNARGGTVSLNTSDVTTALGYAPLSSAGGTISGALTLNGGGTLAGTLTNGGTIAGGSISGAALAGSATIASTVTASTAAAGDNSTKLATTAYVYQANAGTATVSVTGGSTALTAAQYGVPVIVVTGALTTAATLVMPNTGAWTVANRTTGAFSLTVKTAAGTGVTIAQGFSQTLTADGVNVVAAITDYTAITLQGTVSNAGTISGGTLAGSITAAGTLSISGVATAATQAGGDNSTRLATTGYVYQATAGAASVATTGGSSTLTPAQYGVPAIIATGVLAANAVFVVPNSGVWMVFNRTSGAFTLTVKTVAGTGVLVAQGFSQELVADGTNVVIAATDYTGMTLQGAVTNAGTITGGTLAGTVTAAGTLNISGTAIANTQALGDNSTKLATTAYVYQAATASATVATTGGATTLTAAQYGVAVILVTGALTSNATFVVPNNGVWTVANRTSGAFTLTVKTATGSGLTVAQGFSQFAVADGANVVPAANDYTAATLQGAITNAGTVAGGTLSPATLVAGAAGSTLTVSQTTDAGGYHPMVLRGGGTNVNVPIVLAPAGAGYLAAALSDGTAANGNQRGQYAVDLSQSRGAATQVASGAYATIVGGSNNTAAGSYSLAVGQGNSATGQGSVALGQFATDGGAYGKLVFSANAGTVGNQFAVSTLFVSSVSAATRMTSDGAAPGAGNSLPIRSNHVIAGTLTVAARNVANGDAASWSIPVLFKNSAGTVTVSSPGTASIAPAAADATLSTASIAITADNTNKGLAVTITPPASVTLNASAILLAAEM